jgi:hypothetical protein
VLYSVAGTHKPKGDQGSAPKRRPKTP